jgi:putative component of toxin-antitoxin plasmid stabilization module
VQSAKWLNLRDEHAPIAYRRGGPTYVSAFENVGCYRRIAMALWTYYCYDDGREEDIWHRWFRLRAERDDRLMDNHAAVLARLDQRQAWGPPDVKPLSGKLREIRLSGDVEWRLLGGFGHERGSFVIVLICNHKQRRYDPPDALKTAAKRLREIQRDPKKVRLSARPRSRQRPE